MIPLSKTAVAENLFRTRVSSDDQIDYLFVNAVQGMLDNSTPHGRLGRAARADAIKNYH